MNDILKIITLKTWKFIFSKTFIWVSLFAIAMGVLEGAVVVYLRELYYPNGFSFPLQSMSTTLAITEIIREFATLIMILAIGILVGKSKIERFAWFIFTFAVWDIVYYIFLFAILQWPSSVFEWDVLFLLPTMWVGPVWSPILIACGMIALAVIILLSKELKNKVFFKTKEILAFGIGSLVCIISFCKDYYEYMVNNYPQVKTIDLFFSKNTFNYAEYYVPRNFDMLIYGIGITILAYGLLNFTVRNYLEFYRKEVGKFISNKHCC